MRLFTALMLLIAAFVVSPAAAETSGQGAVSPKAPSEHKHMPPSDKTKPASQAFMDANAKMHEAMNIEYTGNADVDFVRGMIPHHQGAIDMAQAVIKYGSDPQIRALAQGIVMGQQSEITTMQAWLAKHAK